MCSLLFNSVAVSMESQCSVASSTVDSQVSEDWSTEEEEEDAYEDYYGQLASLLMDDLGVVMNIVGGGGW